MLAGKNEEQTALRRTAEARTKQQADMTTQEKELISTASPVR
jgi:hypothetical protein